MISADRQREERFAYHDFLKEHGVQSFVNVLIPSGKGRAPFGVFQVDSRSPREFRQSDIDFLRTLRVPGFSSGLKVSLRASFGSLCTRCQGKLPGSHPPQGRVRTALIVVPAPSLDLAPRVGQGQEPMCIEALVP